LLRCAQQETGPSITAAALVTAEPDSHRLVAGRYHLPLLSRDRLGIAWTGPDGPARLLDEFRRRAGRMPVAAVLGGDPACLLAASAVLPAAADPWVLAGVLRDKPLDVVACRTVDLHVPADADFVLEGYIDPSEPFVEAGPIHTSLGHCTLPRPVPVMHVTAITHRANPVFPALVPGSTPDESCVIDHALVRIFQPLVRHAVPELVDYDLPLFGAVRQWAVLSIRKTYPGQARRVASLAWGLRPFLFAKVLVLVGEEVDVRDANRVLSEIVAHVDPSRDIFFHQGPPDPLDPSQTPGTMGHRMALDATAKLAEERSGPRAQRAAIGEEVCRLVAERWNEYGLGPAPGVP
jgi:4-hydroxy-3-polyprenylbenzoate decarboxylase